jgi:hypothetical protein
VAKPRAGRWGSRPGTPASRHRAAAACACLRFLRLARSISDWMREPWPAVQAAVVCGGGNVSSGVAQVALAVILREQHQTAMAGFHWECPMSLSRDGVDGGCVDDFPGPVTMRLTACTAWEEQARARWSVLSHSLAMFFQACCRFI